jgi:hypothetical protein
VAKARALAADRAAAGAGHAAVRPAVRHVGPSIACWRSACCWARRCSACWARWARPDPGPAQWRRAADNDHPAACIPAIIFGAGAVGAVEAGLSASGHFSLLGALLIATGLGAPLATGGRAAHRHRMSRYERRPSLPRFDPVTPDAVADPPRATRHPRPPGRAPRGCSPSPRRRASTALAGYAIPWLWVLTRGAGGRRPVHGLLRRAHRRHAGRGLPHHLHPRAGGLDVDAAVPGDGLLGRRRLGLQRPAGSMVARAIAPTGAMFTFLALWTGALWGKPTWGTWWVWDARLTSELILLFLYLGYMALVNAIDDRAAPTTPARCWPWWARQRAHHLLLGEVVEHAAPGRHRQPHARAQDGQHHAHRDAADDLRLLGLCLRRGVHAHACAIILERERRPTGWARSARGGARMNWNSAAEFFRHGRLRALRLGLVTPCCHHHGGRAAAGPPPPPQARDACAQRRCKTETEE